ncbi:MFS transporter [Herbiconiux sp. L3-i23]|uniref:MFS transporter n=1 Tax=Herbiconiux sp. L3-i23 TaxID=2905871 RepID=UPI00204A618A|nr:MFS transporter [Herbiconiux sp. L3-i23]BDI22073.1 putative MFS transporter [Herbiconiux sp. L3-i23]
MTSAPQFSDRAGRILALAGIVLAALGMRTAVAVISPIADYIAADIPLGSVGLGVLGMVPPVAFAAFALLTPAIVARLGLERSMVVALALMVVGHLLRGYAPGYAVLLIGTVVTLVGIGIGNVLLPPLVRRYFPTRIGVFTSITATLMAIGTAVPSVLAVPIATSAGWRLALGVWAALAIASLVPWIALLAGLRWQPSAALEEPSPTLITALWRSKTAVAVAVVFATSALAVYSMFAWLPQILAERTDLDAAAAGALLSLFSLAGFPVGIVMPILAARMRNVAPLIYLAFVLFALGYGGLLFVPGIATWLWVLFAGLGPLLFPVALALIALRSRTHAGTVALSGFAQGIGYTAAAVGPLLVGVLHDVTGSYDASLVLLFLLTVPSLAAAYVLRRPRFVEDEIEARGAR